MNTRTLGEIYVESEVYTSEAYKEAFSKSKDEQMNNFMIIENGERQLKLLESIVDASLQIYKEKAINEDTIEPFILGIKSNFLAVWSTAGYRMFLLSNHFHIVKQFLLDLMNDKSYTTRFNIVACIEKNADPDLINSILDIGLKDRSSKVRAKVADVIWRLYEKEYLIKLEKQLKIEPDEKVVQSILFTLNNFENYRP